MEQRFKYNNREYVFSSEKGCRECFKVYESNGEDKSIPDKLVKYYSLLKHNVDALLHCYLFASHPKHLNDPFDNYPYLLDTSEIINDENALRKIFKGLSESEIQRCIGNSEEILKYLDLRLYLKMGIISMTSYDNNNPSIWSHYAQNKGFSVIFDTKKLRQSEELYGPFPVDYIENGFDKIQIGKDNFGAQIFCKSMIKHKVWEGEKELRFLGEKKGKAMFHPDIDFGIPVNSRCIYYDISAIKEVQLGFYFFDPKWLEKINEREYLVRIPQDKNLHKELLNFLSRKNISIKMIVLDQNVFEYKAISIVYEYNPDGNSFRYREVGFED